MKSNNSINTSRGQRESIISQFSRQGLQDLQKTASKKEEKVREEVKIEKKLNKLKVEPIQKKKKILSTPVKKVKSSKIEEEILLINNSEPFIGTFE